MKKFVLWFGVVAVITAALAMAVPALPQNPQTQTAPLFATNAKYTNGTAPGYWPTQQAVGARPVATGLNINVGPGTANCGSGTIIQYAGGTFALTASATNRIYLDTASSCAPAVKTSVFTGTDIPIAVVVTSGSAITAVFDDRTPFGVPPSTGGGLPTATTAGQFPVSTGAGTTYVVAPNSYYAATTDDWTAVSTKCSTVPIVYIVNVHVTMAPPSPASLPACLNVVWLPNGQFINSTSNLITIINPTQGSFSDKHLSGPFAFQNVNGGSSVEAPLSWWDAGAGDNSTDISAALAACAAAHPKNCVVPPGISKYGTAVVFGSSGLSSGTPHWTGLVGYAPNIFGFPDQAVLDFTGSTSATPISFLGSSGAHYGAAEVRDFTLLRETRGVAGSTGIQFTFVDDMLVNRLISINSANPYGLRSFNRIHHGEFTNSLAYWDNAHGSWSTETTCGWNVDTSSDVGNESIYLTGNEAASSTSTSLDSYGVCGNGTHLADLRIKQFATSNIKWGVKYNGAGAGPFRNNDDAITDSLFDAVYGGAVWVSNAPLTDTTNLIIHGNECALISNASNVACWYADTSSGVVFANNAGATTSGATAPTMYAHASSHVIYAHNTCSNLNGSTGPCALADSASSLISFNADDMYSTGGPTVHIAGNSTKISVEASNIDGTGTGLLIDAGSSAIKALSNNFGSGLSAQVTDNGTNNFWCDDTSCHGLGGGHNSAGSAGDVQSSDGSGGFLVSTQTNVSNLGYVADSGTANVYAATLAPAIVSYTSGLIVRVKIANPNTVTNPTLNVNGLGTKTIVKNGAGALVAGDLAAGQIQIFQYDGTNFQLLNPATFVGNVTGTSPIVVTPSGSNYAVGCPTCGTAAATAVNMNGGATLGTLQITGNTTQACPDTSGSGTVQTCSTATSFTPWTNSCVVYSTTTPNSGAGLTLNVNSLGAKSIAIPGASGWTTTLTASIIPSGKPLTLCYDGTNWNVQQTGTAASSSASAPVRFIQSAMQTFASASSFTYTFPSALQASGATALIAFTVTDTTWTAPAGWTCNTVTAGTSGGFSRLAVCLIASASQTSINFTSSTTLAGLRFWEIAGTWAFDQVSSAQTGTTNNTTVNFPSITPTGNGLVFALLATTQQNNLSTQQISQTDAGGEWSPVTVNVQGSGGRMLQGYFYNFLAPSGVTITPPQLNMTYAGFGNSGNAYMVFNLK